MRAAVAVASLVLVLAGCTSVSPRIIEDSIVRVAVDAPMTTLNPASLAASGSADASAAAAAVDTDVTLVERLSINSLSVVALAARAMAS